MTTTRMIDDPPVVIPTIILKPTLPLECVHTETPSTTFTSPSTAHIPESFMPPPFPLPPNLNFHPPHHLLLLTKASLEPRRDQGTAFSKSRGVLRWSL